MISTDPGRSTTIASHLDSSQLSSLDWLELAKTTEINGIQLGSLLQWFKADDKAQGDRREEMHWKQIERRKRRIDHQSKRKAIFLSHWLNEVHIDRTGLSIEGQANNSIITRPFPMIFKAPWHEPLIRYWRINVTGNSFGGFDRFRPISYSTGREPLNH